MPSKTVVHGTIHPDELRGYTLDRATQWTFNLRYAPIWVAGILLFIAGTKYSKDESTSLWFFFFAMVGSVSLIGFAWFLHGCGTPISRVSGLPMQRYMVIPAALGSSEDWVFLCPVSKTYFRRTYLYD